MSQDASNQITQAFLDAVGYFAHSGDVTYLLLPQRALLGVPNANGDSSLHTAIVGGRTDAAHAIAKVMQPQDLDNYNADQQTALHLAVSMGQLEITEELLSLGANVYANDARGSTALHLACHSGKPRLVQSIMSSNKQTDFITHINYDGLAAIHVAVLTTQPEILDTLLSYSTVPVNTLDGESGRTALHLAVHHNLLHQAEALLAHGPAIDIQDAFGNTALHLAAESNNSDMALLLLNNGADVSLLNSYGQTALDIAYSNGSEMFSRVLVSPDTVSVSSNEVELETIADDVELEAGYEMLVAEDVSTIPSSEWQMQGLNSGARQAKSMVSKILRKGSRKHVKASILPSRSKKSESEEQNHTQNSITLFTSQQQNFGFAKNYKSNNSNKWTLKRQCSNADFKILQTQKDHIAKESTQNSTSLLVQLSMID